MPRSVMRFFLWGWSFFFLLTFVLRVSHLKLVSLVHYIFEQRIYFKRFYLRQADRRCLLLSVSFPLEYSKRTFFFWDWYWAVMDGFRRKMKKKLWRKEKKEKKEKAIFPSLMICFLLILLKCGQTTSFCKVQKNCHHWCFFSLL